MDRGAFLREGIERLGLELDNQEEAVGRLLRYAEELLRWNRKVNLVARHTTERELLENHFLDSLLLLRVVGERRGRSPRPLSLLDVGSGAGFPGLVLKAACPSLAVTLVEPRQKRVSFLRHVIRTLSLGAAGGIAVEEIRLDPAGGGESLLPENSFDLVTSRALTDIAGFLAMTGRYCATGGVIVCMKGARAEEEAAQLPATSPFVLRDSFRTTLPYSGASRFLLVYGKRGEGEEQGP